MEGARLRSSVALPREVATPSVVEDNGEKITLKAGQEIICNLVRNANAFDKSNVYASTYRTSLGCGIPGS